jgi:hypothetical protein
MTIIIFFGVVLIMRLLGIITGKLNAHRSPCVVLVFHENLYRLMFVLSFSCRFCP